MEFEEMKVIWQNDEPMYAIDRNKLHARVRHHGTGAARWVNVAEAVFVLMFFTMAVLVAVEPLLEGHDWHQLFDATVYLIVVGYLVSGVIQRRRQERGFESSLRGDLDKAIYQVNHHISRWESLCWWCLLPLGLTTVVSFALLYGAKPAWLWAASLFGLSFTWYASRKELSCKLRPKKRDLEALRKLLVEDTQAE